MTWKSSKDEKYYTKYKERKAKERAIQKALKKHEYHIGKGKDKVTMHFDKGFGNRPK